MTKVTLEEFPSMRLEDLARLLMSSTFGGKFNRFLLDRFEIAALFEKEDVSVPEIRSLYSFALATTRALEHTPELLGNFEQSITIVKPYLPPPLTWAALLGFIHGGGEITSISLSSNKDEYLVTSRFAQTVTPILTASALAVSRKKLMGDFLEAIGGSLNTSVQHGEVQQNSVSDVQHTIRVHMLIALGELSDALTELRLKPVGQTSLRWLTDEVLDRQDPSLIEEWAQIIFTQGEKSFYVSRLLREAKRNPKIFGRGALDLLLHSIEHDPRGNNIHHWALEFANDTSEVALGSELRYIFWEKEAFWNPVTLNLVIKSYLINDSLEDLAEKLQGLERANFIDFVNLDFILRLAQEKKLGVLTEAANHIRYLTLEGFDSTTDIGLLLKSFLLERGMAVLPEVEFQELLVAASNQSSVYASRSQSEQFNRHLVNLLAELAVFKSKFYETQFELICEVFEPFRKFRELFPNLQEIYSLPNDVSFKQTAAAHRLEFGALVEVMSESVRISELGWLNTAWSISSALRDVGHYLPPDALARLALAVWKSSLSQEEKIERTMQIFELPGQLASSSVHKLLVLLERESSGRQLLREIRDLALAEGVELGPTSHALVVNSEIKSGIFDQRDAILGPDSETWQSLATVLDDVIHEVNQPLAAIGSSLVELRFALRKTGQDPASFNALSRLESSLQILASRVDEYQALVLQGTKKTELSPYEIMLEVISELGVFAEDSGVTVRFIDRELKVPPTMVAEAFKLKLAFRNLLRNAIQASEQSDRRIVTVNIFTPKGSASDLMIQVTDSGGGIPDDLRERIFEKGLTTKPGRGLGLGLSLTASAIRDLGGSVYLENSGPTGSTFVLRLPSTTKTETEAD